MRSHMHEARVTASVAAVNKVEQLEGICLPQGWLILDVLYKLACLIYTPGVNDHPHILPDALASSLISSTSSLLSTSNY